ncbi:MAG TPA: YggS family pyridoxal phosphate-dependent enzyme [Bacteroidales bacterium]|nr:YggS family pyridoxal phosphate-dependent enzyme [Bacteroidales bacterium]
MVNVEQYKKIIAKLPAHVTLVAVSKNKSIDDILELYNLGQRDFGENKVQELVPKHGALPKDIRWHFVGHLQSNKVKFIAPFIHLIHSADSLKLLQTIDKEAAKNKRRIDCLMQIFVADEETKFGMSFAEAIDLLENNHHRNSTHISIRGLMGMATFTSDVDKIRNEFRSLHNFFNQSKIRFFDDNADFTTLSMGMTDDLAIALEEGSTMVRIGSALFGVR